MSPAAQPVAGKTILITGAARGIGAEAARRLAARGARLVLAGLEPGELERVARECGDGTLSFECDVTDVESLAATIDATLERMGGIDVVIANAGVGGGGLVRSADPAAFERTIEVNLLGVWRTIRAALPAVIERRGYLLPVASLAAVSPYFPGMAAYSASKAGVEAFARTLRVEVAHLGVDVGVAYFSWIATDMVSGADEHPAFKFLRSRLPGPFGRTYPVADAAEAVVRGVEHRAPVVMAPRWIAAMLRVRGLLDPLMQRGFRSAVPEAAALYEAEIQSIGAGASRAVGAGGEADARVAGLGAASPRD